MPTEASNIIFHVARNADWQESVGHDQYAPTAFKAEGFIHCCEPAQLPGVLQRYFNGQKDLLLLHLDKKKLMASLKYERSTGNELFPHLYGVINKAAVVKVELLR